MRGETTYRILCALEDAKDGILESAAIMFSYSGYMPSSRKVLKGAAKEYFEKRDDKKKEKRAMYNRYYALVNRLTEDGLIEKSGNYKNVKYKITKLGLLKIQSMNNAVDKENTQRYTKKEGPHDLTIVAFDVPESLRKKRNWLRGVLQSIGFSMIQKSVWYGKVGLSKEFIDELLEERLINYVEIFQISKQGSLKSIKITKS